MSTGALGPEAAWAPSACTLPTVDRPLRIAEFDELFAGALRGLDRYQATGLRMDLEPTPEVAARAVALVVREAECCSFFTFALVATCGAVRLDITVPATQAGVLDALRFRAAAAAGLPT
jgi:hypothetical protein